MGNIFIDSDFRGEPIARLLNLGRKEFPIWHGRRLVQIAFLNGKGVRHPTLTPVRSISELGSTIRGNGCHGSSGK
jgi:dUTPase